MPRVMYPSLALLPLHLPHYRYGQHHRCGNSHRPGWSGCCAVVLADRCIRYIHQICRRLVSSQISCEDPARPHVGSYVRLGERPGLEMARHPLRNLCRDSLFRHRQHRTGKRHLYPRRKPVWHFSLHHRNRCLRLGSSRHHRRSEINIKSMWNACSLHGSFLCVGMHLYSLCQPCLSVAGYQGYL